MSYTKKVLTGKKYILPCYSGKGDMEIRIINARNADKSEVSIQFKPLWFKESLTAPLSLDQENARHFLYMLYTAFSVIENPGTSPISFPNGKRISDVIEIGHVRGNGAISIYCYLQTSPRFCKFILYPNEGRYNPSVTFLAAIEALSTFTLIIEESFKKLGWKI